MIRFCCDYCNHRISVPDERAGRRGKCPECDNIITVPEESTLVGFHCHNCGEKISAFRTQAGKKGKCPRCKLPVAIPGKLQQESPAHIPKVRTEGYEEETVSGLSLEERQILGGEARDDDTEPTGQRRFPWPLDILLYPTDASGLVHVAVFLFVPILLKLLLRFVSMGFGPRAGLLIMVLYLFFVGYVFSYLVECIRDSAGGEVRASDPPSGMSSKDEILGQYAIWLACYAFFFGPVTFYRGYIHFSGAEMNNAVFWPLLGYGVFFFPMGILAATMFDSVNGLNPILLVCSIISTFFQYCGLVMFFACFCFLRVGLLMLSFSRGWGILANIVPDLLLIWLLLVAVHLIGRFYWRYQDKLNWEA